MQTRWFAWREIPWFSRSDSGGNIWQLSDRLQSAALEIGETKALLRQVLPEIAAEFSCQWAGVLQRSPEWIAAGEFGRHPLPTLPQSFMDETLDRDSAGWAALDEPAGWTIVTVPLSVTNWPPALLMLAGRNLPQQVLAGALAAGRGLALALANVVAKAANLRRIENLRSIIEVASSFAGMRESRPLLELIAEQATKMLDCDRASIFIWDREHKQVVACPALGVEGRTLRLPDDTGVVGVVIHGGKTIRVDDTSTDPRFSEKVDKQSGYSTRNLLCTPLRDRAGQVLGAFEVMNRHGGPFSTEDEETLSHLATQATVAIQNTLEREQLIRSRENLAQQVTRGVQIIGESPAILALRSTIERLAMTDLPVLILGESGTGKEVVAQALHYQGSRADQPFVAVNCAAIAETLLESELFGHEKGAFTDAHATRQGKFELAEGGTLFLDEIGDMSLGGQAKLLRVLEQKVITRVGGSQTIPINVRVVAATNANLVEKVRDRKFREDLYYRLSVVTQNLLPLRERPEDVTPLAQHFLKGFCLQARRAMLQFTAEAKRGLQSHAWPGNVRELRNLMERIAFLCRGDKIELDDLAFIHSPDHHARPDEPALDIGLAEATQQFQQDYIRRVIKRVQGNMSEAARLMGLHRSNLYRKMRQLFEHELSAESAISRIVSRTECRCNLSAGAFGKSHPLHFSDRL